MKKNALIIATLSLGISASTLVAQEDGRPRGPRPPGQEGQGGPRMERRHLPPPPLITALDANKDGTISADELNNSANALRALDKNSDGQLTPEELHPPRPEGGPGPERKGPPPPAGEEGGPRFHKRAHVNPPVPPMLNALDANKDKTISSDEIANASNALKGLDKNGDGQITMEELRPVPPPRQEN